MSILSWTNCENGFAFGDAEGGAEKPEAFSPRKRGAGGKRCYRFIVSKKGRRSDLVDEPGAGFHAWERSALPALVRGRPAYPEPDQV
jgi:hypothetical protein